MRFFLDIAYNGTHYHGWQKQLNALSVQEKLEEALGKLCGGAVETLGSGRTDTGVHARQQIAHLDLDFVPDEQFVFRLNCILPSDIVVRNIRQVKEDAHARFDALSRRYQYHIQRQPDPFEVGRSWLKTRLLNVEILHDTAAELMKHEDFESFSKVHTDVKTFNCKLMDSRWEERGEQLIYHVKADRFLRGMVRALVGTQIDVAMGKTTLEEFRTIILSKDRKKAGQAAPAEGLYFCEIEYPKDIYI